MYNDIRADLYGVQGALREGLGANIIVPTEPLGQTIGLNVPTVLGSSIDGTTTFTRTDGSTGEVATVTLATEAQGYKINQRRLSLS